MRKTEDDGADAANALYASTAGKATSEHAARQISAKKTHAFSVIKTQTSVIPHLRPTGQFLGFAGSAGPSHPTRFPSGLSSAFANGLASSLLDRGSRGSSPPYSVARSASSFSCLSGIEYDAELSALVGEWREVGRDIAGVSRPSVQIPQLIYSQFQECLQRVQVGRVPPRASEVTSSSREYVRSWYETFGRRCPEYLELRLSLS